MMGSFLLIDGAEPAVVVGTDLNVVEVDRAR